MNHYSPTTGSHESADRRKPTRTLKNDIFRGLRFIHNELDTVAEGKKGRLRALEFVLLGSLAVSGVHALEPLAHDAARDGQAVVRNVDNYFATHNGQEFSTAQLNNDPQIPLTVGDNADTEHLIKMIWSVDPTLMNDDTGMDEVMRHVNNEGFEPGATVNIPVVPEHKP